MKIIWSKGFVRTKGSQIERMLFGASGTQRRNSKVLFRRPCILCWADSISPKGFLSSILLWVVIMVAVVEIIRIITVVAIIRIVVAVDGVIYNVVEKEDGEWICFLSGSSSSGTKKYRGSNSSDGGNTGDGVKIAGEVIGSGDEIEFSEELKELLPNEAGKESDETEV
ncbi:hypothetical protein Tco_0237424 [Tanacetum coccineum]